MKHGRTGIRLDLHRATWRLLRLVALWVVPFLSADALAQTVTWIGSGNGNWHTASNWSPAIVPTTTSDVVIPSGSGTVNISTADVSVRSLDAQRRLTVSGRVLTVQTANLQASIALTGAASLEGGVYTIGVGGAIEFPAPCNTPGRLSNVTVNGDLPNFSGYVRWNNVTLNGTLTSSSSTTYIAFEGNQTLTGTIVNPTTSTMYLAPWTGTTGTLTIGGGAAVRGGAIIVSSSNPCSGTGSMSVVNNGTIDANVSGRFIDLSAPFLSVNGSLRGTGLRLNSDMNLGGGALDMMAGGQLSVTPNATIQNGTINTTGQLLFPAPCNTPGRLSNVTVNGDLPNFSGYVRWNNVTLNGTLTSAATTTYIVFEGNQTLSGTIVNPTTSTMYLAPWTGTTGTLTIGNGAAVRGGAIIVSSSNPCSGTGSMSVVNNGTIDANVSGRFIDLSAPFLSVNGSLRGTGLRLNSDMNLGGGALDMMAGGQLSVTPNATIQNGTINTTGQLLFPAPCNTPGRLSNVTVNGDLRLFAGHLAGRVRGRSQARHRSTWSSHPAPQLRWQSVPLRSRPA